MNQARVFLAIFLFAISPYSFGQETKSNQIVVYGDAEVEAPADKAVLNFSMKGVGSSLRNAVANAQNQVIETTKRLLDLGLKKNNLNTLYFHTGENYGNKAFLSSKRDYQAVITVFITIDSLSLLEPIIFALSEIEVENISDRRDFIAGMGRTDTELTLSYAV